MTEPSEKARELLATDYEADGDRAARQLARQLREGQPIVLHMMKYALRAIAKALANPLSLPANEAPGMTDLMVAPENIPDDLGHGDPLVDPSATLTRPVEPTEAMVEAMERELDRQRVPFAPFTDVGECVVVIYGSPAVDLAALAHACLRAALAQRGSEG